MSQFQRSDISSTKDSLAYLTTDQESSEGEAKSSHGSTSNVDETIKFSESSSKNSLQRSTFNMIIAEPDYDLQMIRVVSGSGGSNLITVGKRFPKSTKSEENQHKFKKNSDSLFLFPEEALFLCEKGVMKIIKKFPFSTLGGIGDYFSGFQEYYALFSTFFSNQFSIPRYMIYSHFRRLGNVIQKVSWDNFGDFEKFQQNLEDLDDQKKQEIIEIFSSKFLSPRKTQKIFQKDNLKSKIIEKPAFSAKKRKKSGWFGKSVLENPQDDQNVEEFFRSLNKDCLISKQFQNMNEISEKDLFFPEQKQEPTSNSSSSSFLKDIFQKLQLNCYLVWDLQKYEKFYQLKKDGRKIFDFPPSFVVFMGSDEILSKFLFDSEIFKTLESEFTISFTNGELLQDKVSFSHKIPIIISIFSSDSFNFLEIGSFSPINF